MKRTFTIEYPDDCGPLWMNVDNLLLVMTTRWHTSNAEITVEDITDDEHLRVKRTAVGTWRLAHNQIAGAIFDFAAFLTCQKEPLLTGATCESSAIIARIEHWAKERGLLLDEPDVLKWNERD